MKSKNTSILALSAIVAMLSVVSIAGIPESNAAKSKMYEVTITNLTPGQPITPPLLVTHSVNAGFFTVGEMASDGIQQLAENGNPEQLVNMLQGKSGILSIVQGETPLVPANDPGNTGLSYSETFVVSSEGKMNYLSFASMLVCTNDGFAGIDSVKLPITQKTIYVEVYDARTEMNTEDFADIVPPCQDVIGISSDDEGTGVSNPAIAEDGIIIPHPGIMGGEDLLESVHAWGNPVVKIDIVRMK
ncbi:MAG: spondin domain-containing protein [Nitrosopumilus sp.]|nr:spondin domain-containing protein [Nitrosopumilus sp.]MDH3487507.1 spondin domain-containing protein [Nitrosopumilus sp.]